MSEINTDPKPDLEVEEPKKKDASSSRSKSPPSYDDITKEITDLANSGKLWDKKGVKTKSYILTFFHRAPSGLNQRGQVTLGKLIEKLDDAILLPSKETDLPYEVLTMILEERMKKRFQLDCDAIIKKGNTIGYTVFLVLPERRISVCAENWSAVMGLLETKGAEMEFAWVEFPKTYKGEQETKAKKGGKCVVQ